MEKSMEIKLKGMLWDFPSEKKEVIFKQITENPYKAFQDEQVLIRGLNSLNWYDLIHILGSDNLFLLLSESVISKLYPQQRRLYYKDAKELLSKYTIPLTR